MRKNKTIWHGFSKDVNDKGHEHEKYHKTHPPFQYFADGS